jgi:hypothetical protein
MIRLEPINKTHAEHKQVQVCEVMREMPWLCCAK